MKKLSLLLFSTLMALCLLVSCGDDDEDLIGGVWTVSGVTLDVKTNNPLVDQMIKGINVLERLDLKTIEFAADNKYKLNGVVAGTYAVNGKSIVIVEFGENGEEEEPWTVQYSIKGKDLTMTGDGTKQLQGEEFEIEGLVIEKASMVMRCKK